MSNLHIILHSGPIGWTNLHSHQQYIKLPFSPHPFQYVLSLVFLLITILIGGKWCLIVVLIRISWWLVMLSVFSCTYWPSVCLFRKTSSSSVHFKIGVFFFLLSDWKSSLYMFNINPLSDTCFAEFFSHHVGFFFSFW